MPRINVGDTVGRWEVLEYIKKTPNYKSQFICRCECGVVRSVSANNLRSGVTKSCGCLRSELTSMRCRTACHNHRRLYGAYATMKSRCYNQNFPKYQSYGARGIRVCERWRESFDNFLADMGEPSEGMTLERENVNGDYCPENCRWATPKEQSRNQRTNRIGYVNGEKMCVAEAAERFGVNYRTVMSRLNRGLTMEQAVGAA